ncbi:MAG: response regulator, partial [Lachnospiraceae bacterium]|nr:response regulator [Lachnospiraceae bacterium]
MSIRVMLADDHILMREGIRQLLECDNLIEIVGEVSNGEQCLEMINKVKPQVLLLD